MDKKKIKIAILALSSVIMASMIASAILADISVHFKNVDKSMIQLVLTIPALLGMVFAFISGPLSIKVSKKTLVLSGLTATFIGGMLALLVGGISIYILLFSSVLIGLGQGINSTMSMSLIADYFEGDECSSLMGLQSAFVNGGSMLMLLLAGILASINWNFSYAIFLVFIPVIAIVVRNLPNDAPIKPNEINQTIKGKLNRTVYFICFIVFCFTALLFVFQTNISLYINNNALGDATTSGLANSLMSGVGAITGVIYGQLRRILKGFILTVAYSITATGMFILFAFGTLPSIFIAAILAGFGLSVIMPTAMFIVSTSVEPSMSATAIAVTNAAANMGVFLSPILLNPLSNALGNGGERIKFLIAAIGLLVLAIIVMINNYYNSKKVYP